MSIAIRFLAYALLIFAAAGMLSTVFVILDPYDDTLLTWLLYSAMLGFFGVAFIFASDVAPKHSDRWQALMTCGSIAMILPVVISFPFFSYGYSAMGSLFESVSGLTTTGSSALARPSLLPDALIVWRLLVEWIGGWMFLVFAIALQPILNIAGMAYAVNYLPHGEATSFFARTVRTSLMIAKLYAALTGLIALFLMLIGMPTRTALPMAMIGISTGGYLPVEQGVSLYSGGLIHIGIAMIMLMGCLNFTLHYVAVRGSFSVYWRDIETKALLKLVSLGFLAIFAVSIISGTLQQGAIDVMDIIFMALSAVSTMGLSPLGTQTAPLSIGILLLSLCVAGGMAGSTTGGIKTLRAVLIDRFVNAELIKVSNPNRLNPVSFEGRIIKVSDMMGVWALVLVIAATVAIGSLVLSALQMPFLTAIAVSVSSVTNAGPLPELIDARFAGYGAFTDAMLAACSCLMLLGKMEFLVLLSFVFNRFVKR